MASIDVRNMDALFGTYGMQIDHTEANKVNFPSDIDPIKLKEFQDKFEHSGMGTVVINPDGSFDIRTMDKTIQFAPILSNALSPAIDIQLMQNMKTKVDAHYTNKKTILEGKINTETNEKIKKELQEDLDTLEKAYEKFNKILDGTITIDSYVGIRNIAKPL
ncbi:hypothetical protein KA037_01465 [Patescibacteria group bacterium]|nr:hypothetical protein [Patescibacteria group bacterium]MBP7841331.1 hypothetical protein [Patescibacteria group bacterium]